MNQKTSHNLTIKTIFTFAVMLPLFCLTIAKADGILLPEKPATNWEKQAFPLGNGRLDAQRTFFGNRSRGISCVFAVIARSFTTKQSKM